MKKVGLVLMVVLATVGIVWSYSSGPPDARTGAPGEALCTQCHTTFPPNSGDGSLSLTGLPVKYVSGSVYTLTATLSDPGQSRWGFELAVKDTNNMQAGMITVTDAVNTQSSVMSGITYLKQTTTGTYAGTTNGPASWSFDWTAPSGKGKVVFYVAGNAANNNGSTSGDYIYNLSQEVSEQPAFGGNGDVNCDGKLNVTDVIYTINYLFKGGPIPCTP